MRRIIRIETLSPGNRQALWEDADGNRWYETIEVDGELTW